MAFLDVEISFDTFEALKKLENMEAWAPDVVKKIGAEFAGKIKKNLASHKDTGDLIDSIEVQEPEFDKAHETCSVSIYNPKAPTHGTRNAVKLAELEYGNSKGQEASHVVSSARKSIERKAKKIIEEKLKELTGG